MFFDVYGDEKNPVLVLLHGAAALDTFAQQYEPLARSFRVLVPHLPGAGNAAAERYDPQETTDALAAWIASLGVGRVLVMGHSVGAELAVKLVSEHEALFSRAVFLSPWLLATPASVKLYSALARRSYRAIKDETLLRLQAKYWNLNAAQADRLVSYSKQISLETYVSFYGSRVNLNTLSGYPAVSIPMLAMCARGDSKETKASVRALGERNTNCLTVIFPQGSHDFVLRNARFLNPMLLDFLAADGSLPSAR